MTFILYFIIEPYLLRSPNNRSKRRADMINGTASPSEYMLNRRAPFRALPSLEARINMEDNAGPMQGVQPREKATPTMKEPKIPRGFFFN